MKNLRYLTIVAAAMLMAGIVVAADQPEAAEKAEAKPSWEFKGQAVLYYQTADGWGAGSLFDQGPGSDSSGWAKAAGGVQIGGVAKDLAGGFGAGFKLAGISALALHNNIVSGLVQSAGGTTDGYTGGAVNEGYLTYGLGKTSLKVGRQELPKSLSPFAYSEGWNVFANSFDAGLLVNSSIKDTTLVYAYVTKRNNSVGNLNDFLPFYDSDGAHMLTAQNTSIKKLTLTASYYYLPDATDAGNANAWWLDGTFKGSVITLGLQGGEIGGGAVPENNTGLGAKIAGKIGPVNASLAYSSTGDGSLNIANLAGAGVKSPLYTQGVLNQNAIKRDADSFKLTLAMKGLGGTFVLALMNSDLGETALPSVFGMGVGGAGTYNEYELIYKRGIGKHTKMFTAFIHQNDDRQPKTGQNFFRIWFRYGF